MQDRGLGAVDVVDEQPLGPHLTRQLLGAAGDIAVDPWGVRARPCGGGEPGRGQGLIQHRDLRQFTNSHLQIDVGLGRETGYRCEADVFERYSHPQRLESLLERCEQLRCAPGPGGVVRMQHRRSRHGLNGRGLPQLRLAPKPAMPRRRPVEDRLWDAGGGPLVGCPPGV